MKSDTRTAAAAVAAMLCAAAVAGCSGGGSGGSPAAAPAEAADVARASSSPSAGTSSAAPGSGTVDLKSTSLGKVLVNGKGRTLYLFEKDKTTKSTCEGACALTWPPLLTTGKPTAGKGVKDSLLSSTTRSGGVKQITYNGHPVYMFKGDMNPGNTNGQGVSAFGAKWYVLDSSGKKNTTPQQNSGGGY
ncbi:hypothetical protein [Streptomyces sp. NPDC051569]|uniref:hypothetical protein n=1 Tax=Streptomyces sp. NPDC051569 TaxID=3365661 RepID=UPI00378C52EA